MPDTKRLFYCPYCGAGSPQFNIVLIEYDGSGNGGGLRLQNPIWVTTCCGKLQHRNLNPEQYAMAAIKDYVAANLLALREFANGEEKTCINVNGNG